MRRNIQKFIVQCARCRCTTSKNYAHAHGGLCKGCSEPHVPRDHRPSRPTRNERILESGYLQYSLEEDHHA